MQEKNYFKKFQNKRLNYALYQEFKKCKIQKKLFYKIIELFEIEDIINLQIYCLRLLKY